MAPAEDVGQKTLVDGWAAILDPQEAPGTPGGQRSFPRPHVDVAAERIDADDLRGHRSPLDSLGRFDGRAAQHRAYFQPERRMNDPQRAVDQLGHDIRVWVAEVHVFQLGAEKWIVAVVQLETQFIDNGHVRSPSCTKGYAGRSPKEW